MTDRNLKISALFLFEKKNTTKRTKFLIFKGLFLCNGWPYEYDFWRVFRD